MPRAHGRKSRHTAEAHANPGGAKTTAHPATFAAKMRAAVAEEETDEEIAALSAAWQAEQLASDEARKKSKVAFGDKEWTHVQGGPPRTGSPCPKLPFVAIPSLGFFDEDSSSDRAEAVADNAAEPPWWETPCPSQYEVINSPKQ